MKKEFNLLGYDETFNHQLWLAAAGAQLIKYKNNNEIRKNLDDAYNRVKAVLNENIDKLNSISKILLEKERIEGEEFEMLMNDQAIADA